MNLERRQWVQVALFKNVSHRESFTEGQAFQWLYDLAPPPTPFPPLMSASYLSLSAFLCRWLQLTAEERVEEEPNHTTERKPGPLYII